MSCNVYIPSGSVPVMIWRIFDFTNISKILITCSWHQKTKPPNDWISFQMLRTYVLVGSVAHKLLKTIFNRSHLIKEFLQTSEQRNFGISLLPASLKKFWQEKLKNNWEIQRRRRCYFFISFNLRSLHSIQLFWFRSVQTLKQKNQCLFVVTKSIYISDSCNISNWVNFSTHSCCWWTPCQIMSKTFWPKSVKIVVHSSSDTPQTVIFFRITVLLKWDIC